MDNITENDVAWWPQRLVWQASGDVAGRSVGVGLVGGLSRDSSPFPHSDPAQTREAKRNWMRLNETEQSVARKNNMRKKDA